MAVEVQTQSGVEIYQKANDVAVSEQDNLLVGNGPDLIAVVARGQWLSAVIKRNDKQPTQG